VKTRTIPAMEPCDSAEDLRRDLQLLALGKTVTMAFCQTDEVLAPSATKELEGFLDKSFGPTCWRLRHRYVGVYSGNADVRARAEELRRAVDVHRFDSSARVTLSIGLSSPMLDLGAMDQLLGAEEALLAARKAGGNRVHQAPKQRATRSERKRLTPGQ